MSDDPESRLPDFFSADANVRRLLARLLGPEFARWEPTLASFGAWVAGEVDAAAAYTDRQGAPTLETYDPDGRVVNRVRHNPAWTAVSAEAYRRGVVGLNYQADPAPFLVTFAMGYLLSQADVSLHCPVTMTGAVAHVLRRFAPAAVRERYLPRLVRMDGEAETGGTWATELHGGSDVGASTTAARPEGDHFRLSGLKWFASNPAGGLALATARPAGAPAGARGLGLYLVPTHLEDGGPNPMRIRRLKDKLGTVGVATGEIDLIDTYAVEVASPPDGLKLMMEALEFSRIHNALASAGLQRRAFVEALGYARRRVVFGRPMTDYPMVREEILKVMAQLDASVALAFAAAHAFEAGAAASDAAGPERTWLRLVTALAKYHTAEEANVACRAAIEIIGGNAYTYDMVTPRLLRDAQAMTVWEGPANIQALELLRLLQPRYGAAAMFGDRVRRAAAGLPQRMVELRETLAAALADVDGAIALFAGEAGAPERHARRLLALMADTLAVALLAEEASEGPGDERKFLVARLFVRQRFRPLPRRGIVPGEDRALASFDALVDYATIDA